MSNVLRREVLKSFKNLHRTRQNVFKGDDHALTSARAEINKQYREKKNMTDKTAIEESVKYANEVEATLRTMVIQAEEIAPGTYQMRLTSETIKMDNVPFNDCGSSSEPPKVKRTRKCS